MENCSRCIRMEEMIVKAFTRHLPCAEYVSAEQALAMLLSGWIPPGTYIGNCTDEKGSLHAGFPLPVRTPEEKASADGEEPMA